MSQAKKKKITDDFLQCTGFVEWYSGVQTWDYYHSPWCRIQGFMYQGAFAFVSCLGNRYRMGRLYFEDDVLALIKTFPPQ